MPDTYLEPRDCHDHAPVGYFTLDPDGTIRQLDLTGASLLGVGRIPLIGRNFVDFVAAESRPDFAAILARACTAEGPRACDVTLLPVRLPRVVAHIRLRAAADGEIQAVVADVTEHRTAEAQLRTILEHIEEGFLAFDKAWRLVQINGPAETLLHIGRVEALGKRFWEMFPHALGTLMEEECGRAAAGEARTFEAASIAGDRSFRYRYVPREGGGMCILFKDAQANPQGAAA